MCVCVCVCVCVNLRDDEVELGTGQHDDAQDGRDRAVHDGSHRVLERIYDSHLPVVGS